MKNIWFAFFGFALISSVIIGCASSSVRYRHSADTQNLERSNDSLKNYQSFYLYGNTGATKKGPNKTLLKAFENHLTNNASEDDYLIFLGDNIYSNDFKIERNKAQFDRVSEVIKNFKGSSIITPGENEWNENGVETVEFIEDYLENFTGKDNQFLPENGCPLEVVDVNDNTQIFVVDSQWYIEDWSKQPQFNDKCQIKTRTEFETILKDEIRKARHKNVLLVMHHPMYSNGIYGGEISNDALYNPSPENLYIPIAGFAWTFLRTQGGLSKQDRYNPLMNRLMENLKPILSQVERVFVLSAHDKSLQYIEHKGLRQIISGTGSGTEKARLGKDGIFSSGKPGFVELRLFEDNSSKVVYYEYNNATQAFSVKLNKIAFEKPKSYNVDSLPTTFEKTKVATVYPREKFDVSKDYEAFYGKHYRYMYGTPIEAPTVSLDTLYGGLFVERAGGGNQTQSLRLVDENDREFNMRAIAKDPYAFLKSAGYNDLDTKDYFSTTVPVELIEDFYTAAHPFGAFTIPRLAGAVDLNHTHPKLFFIPKQKRLGDFNFTHGNRLYMIVEKPDDDFNGTHMFGFNEDVESTADLFEELRDSEDNVLDEQAYIRARIFDFLVGDWDRHEDQWRWAQRTDTQDKTTYVAIPRDRDQVYAKFDGKFIETLKKFIGGTRQFGLYGEDIEYVKSFAESAINLDRALLQRTTLKDWLTEVEFIQRRITPTVVDNAFSELPKEAQDEVAEQIKTFLLKRKARLKSIISEYYEHFISFQTLKGTDKDDHFLLQFKAGGILQIDAHRIKDGNDGALLFSREFKDSETQEIWLFGLDDDDTFDVVGDYDNDIKLVISGGLGEDTYTIKNGQGITVYDQERAKNNIVEKSGARFRINDVYENHIYNSEKRPETKKVFGLGLAYNPDLGSVSRLKIGQKKMGFERNPFTSFFLAEAEYYSLTQAFKIISEFHFAHLFHDWNLKIKGLLTTHNYTENFFGFGNETTFNDVSFDEDRLFIQYISGGASTYYYGEYGSKFEIGVDYLRVNANNLPVIEQPVNTTNTHNYLKLVSQYEYSSTDNKMFPTRGMQVIGKGFFSDNLDTNQTTLGIDPQITFWNAIDSSRDLVLKTGVYGQVRVGQDIPYFQAARIGGQSGLRSYRLQRFTGQQALTASADVLYKFKPLKTPLFPLRAYGYLGYDAGRVWIDEEESSSIHQSYGGGLNMSMSGALKAGFSYFYGEDDGRFTFHVTFGI